MSTTSAEQRVLQAIAAGHCLKVHRDLDGRKLYRLHALDGSVEPVEPHVVERLVARRLIDSNKKFPAATFWLTPSGQRLAR
jgi:uncharacterized protein YjhX (UPF0386 family)